MKKLLFLLMIIVAVPFTSVAKKEHLPFAPKGKYGKYCTKKARNVARKQTWQFRQWGR